MTLHRNRCFVVVDPPTPEDLDLTMAVLDAYTFPWVWTLRDNAQGTGKPDLPIGFKDKPDSLGYYTPTINSINVDPLAVHQGGAVRFGQTLAHELGHYIDDTIFTSDLKIAIHRLMHEGSTMTYDQCIERANAGRERPVPEGAMWRMGNRHSDRASEAFGNLAPHIWCPDYAKNMTSYGPHQFGRADEIRDLVLAEAPNNPPFNDVAGHTFEQSVLWAAAQGIAFGSRGEFNPNDLVTRGQMTAFLRRAVSGLPEDFIMPDPSENVTFNDIAEHTFEADILWAARQGIAQGGTDGNFRPNDPVTRGAMAAFLHRALDPEG